MNKQEILDDLTFNLELYGTKVRVITDDAFERFLGRNSINMPVFNIKVPKTFIFTDCHIKNVDTDDKDITSVASTYDEVETIK